MKLNQVEVFVAVASAGSLTRAAATLAISQSAVSQALDGLEAALGVRLIRRSRAGVTLTAIGKEVLPDARAMLKRAAAIRGAAAAAQGLAHGKLRVATLSSAAATVLPPLLLKFQARHPDLEVVLLEGSDEEVRGWLARGVADVGIVTLPATEFETRSLGRDAWMAVLPRLHPLATSQSVTLRALAAEPFILARGGCEARLVEALRAQTASFEARYEVRDVATLLSLVRERLGVAVLADRALPQDRRGLAVRPISPALFRTFGLALRREPRRAPAIDAFAQLVARGSRSRAAQR
jgi:DNA-binding transcriptional LysR family regulator